MKKKIQKLALSRDTLKNLTQERLEPVLGAASIASPLVIKPTCGPFSDDDSLATR